MKKLITLILFIGLFSCEPNDICENECYKVIDIEVKNSYSIYTLESECSKQKLVFSSLFININYSDREFILNETICDLN